MLPGLKSFLQPETWPASHSSTCVIKWYVRFMFWCCLMVISTIVMSGLILLLLSAFAGCKRPLANWGSRPLLCKYLYGSTKAVQKRVVFCVPTSSFRRSSRLTYAVKYKMPCFPFVNACTTRTVGRWYKACANEFFRFPFGQSHYVNFFCYNLCGSGKYLRPPTLTKTVKCSFE